MVVGASLSQITCRLVGCLPQAPIRVFCQWRAIMCLPSIAHRGHKSTSSSGKLVPVPMSIPFIHISTHLNTYYCASWWQGKMTRHPHISAAMPQTVNTMLVEELTLNERLQGHKALFSEVVDRFPSPRLYCCIPASSNSQQSLSHPIPSHPTFTQTITHAPTGCIC